MDATRKARIISLVFLLVTMVGCDQASKQYATRHWNGAPPQTYLGDMFEIRYAENEGAFLSLFANMPRNLRFWLLTVMNGLVLGGVATFLVTRRNLDAWSFWALALLLAGGIGNLIDRMFLDGIVIDFMVINLTEKSGVSWMKTGVFNIADVAITTGFLMLLPLLFHKESHASEGAAT